jgi:hypothetical protein
MLRIDESSKTLVAPQEAAFVAEAAPARDELLALVSSGWQAFAAEIGQPHLDFCVAAPEPGVDVIAFDSAAGRVAVVQVADDPRSALTAALVAAAEVSGWDATDLAEVHESLAAAVPGDSPKVVLVGGEWDEQTVATMDWLVRRHGLEITAYVVQTLRFGSERLMNVSRAYPAGESVVASADPAAVFAQVGSAAPPAGGASAPPPGVPAA